MNTSSLLLFLTLVECVLVFFVFNNKKNRDLIRIHFLTASILLTMIGLAEWGPIIGWSPILLLCSSVVLAWVATDGWATLSETFVERRPLKCDIFAKKDSEEGKILVWPLSKEGASVLRDVFGSNIPTKRRGYQMDLNHFLTSFPVMEGNKEGLHLMYHPNLIDEMSEQTFQDGSNNQLSVMPTSKPKVRKQKVKPQEIENSVAEETVSSTTEESQESTSTETPNTETPNTEATTN